MRVAVMLCSYMESSLEPPSLYFLGRGISPLYVNCGCDPEAQHRSLISTLTHFCQSSKKSHTVILGNQLTCERSQRHFGVPRI